MRSGQASPGSVARHRRHKRRLEQRPSSSDAADGAESYELRDYHSDSDDDGPARDNSVDDDSDSDGTLNDDDDVTVRQVCARAKRCTCIPKSRARTLRAAQVLYCSRTHSQIAQFVREAKRTGFGNIRCVSLASRRFATPSRRPLRRSKGRRVGLNYSRRAPAGTFA